MPEQANPGTGELIRGGRKGAAKRSGRGEEGGGERAGGRSRGRAEGREGADGANGRARPERDESGTRADGARGGRERGDDGAGRSHRLTIEQLAQETGMTVRNIRAHQSRGLLPAPVIRGRTGYYGREHVARLELIAEMQADGFNLKAIERLVADTGGAAPEQVLGLKRAVTAPFEQEAPELIDDDELAERFGPDTERAIARATKLGVLVPLGEGRYEVPSPILLRAGEELARVGVPVEATLRVVEQLNRYAEGVAEAFVKLFLEQVWRPFEHDGRPQERLPEVQQAIERLRPLASEALLAVFQRKMTREVEEALGRALAGKR